MQDPFDQKKTSILKEIGITDVNNPDASPKGTIDEKCLPIMRIINTDRDMITTSSCSGRVSVFLEGIKNTGADEIQIGAKGNEGRWIFVTHDSKDLPVWFESVPFVYKHSIGDEITDHESNRRYILYKFEPLILHVKCRNLESANALYTAAMGCGFRESGIGTNNIVAIRISIKLDVPIGYLDSKTDELVSFVSKDYLRVITQLSLDRFKENEKKIKVLEDAIESMKTKLAEKQHDHAATPQSKEETKEERQERKRREGLARREGVRAEKEKKKKEKEAAELKQLQEKQAAAEVANK